MKWTNIWHRLMSETHPLRLTIHTVKTTLKKKEKKKKILIASNFLYCVKFCDEEFRLTMLPLTRDKMFVLFFFHGEIFTACQIELFPFYTRIMILYCTYQTHLTCRITTTQRQEAEEVTAVSLSPSQFVEEEEKTANILHRFTQKETGSTVYIRVHTVCPFTASSFISSAARAHVHRDAEAPEASGLVFDSMLSEWLISQCFDLLQLLEVCLVRAWV